MGVVPRGGLCEWPSEGPRQRLSGSVRSNQPDYSVPDPFDTAAKSLNAVPCSAEFTDEDASSGMEDDRALTSDDESRPTTADDSGRPCRAPLSLYRQS